MKRVVSVFVSMIMLLVFVTSIGLCASLKDAPVNEPLGPAYGGSGVTSLARQFVIKTAGTHTLTEDDIGHIGVNTGATGDVKFLAPECVEATVGYWYPFRVVSIEHEFWVDSHANDTLAPIVSVSGTAIEGPQVVGAWVVIECVNLGASYDWMVHDDGTWEDEGDD